MLVYQRVIEISPCRSRPFLRYVFPGKRPVSTCPFIIAVVSYSAPFILNPENSPIQHPFNLNESKEKGIPK